MESAKVRATHEKLRLTGVDKAFVQDGRLKRSIADFLEPNKRSDICLCMDAGNITADPKQVAIILGNTRQSLGGDLHFVPDKDFVDWLLPQIPSAPADLNHHKISTMTLAWLEETLEK